MELTWSKSVSASSFHAAWALLQQRPFVNPTLRDALEDATRALARQLDSLGCNPDRFFAHLIPSAAAAGSCLQLARGALAKCLGHGHSAEYTASVAGHLSDIQGAVSAVLPCLEDELALREQPIRMQWEARGPGLLHLLSRATDESFVSAAASVLLAYPVCGGGGRAYADYNAVVLEATLTDVVAELPEVLRLAWLLAQLNLDLPRYTERLAPRSREMVGKLSQLVMMLGFGQEVELARCDIPTIERAVRAWLPGATLPAESSAILLQWWQIYRDTHPSLAGGLLALEQMLAGQ